MRFIKLNSKEFGPVLVSEDEVAKVFPMPDSGSVVSFKDPAVLPVVVAESVSEIDDVLTGKIDTMEDLKQSIFDMAALLDFFIYRTDLKTFFTEPLLIEVLERQANQILTSINSDVMELQDLRDRDILKPMKKGF